MLETSEANLKAATANEKTAAEAVARRYLACELEENLIAPDEAARIVGEREAQGDETWSRAVHAALMGLRAAEAAGFQLTKI